MHSPSNAQHRSGLGSSHVRRGSLIGRAHRYRACQHPKERPPTTNLSCDEPCDEPRDASSTLSHTIISTE
jgi:hypothetical protein